LEQQGSHLGRGRTRDGRTITWYRRGSGPTLVCHPGGPGFSGVYFEGLGGLDAERTLVLVNPAGTAGSDPWPERAYSLDAAADDLDDVRSALGEERLDVLGHSAGGFVSIRTPTGIRNISIGSSSPTRSRTSTRFAQRATSFSRAKPRIPRSRTRWLRRRNGCHART
jgi:pimeloyl-ACP methyl ester carboxylesterase